MENIIDLRVIRDKILVNLTENDIKMTQKCRAVDKMWNQISIWSAAREKYKKVSE